MKRKIAIIFGLGIIAGIGAAIVVTFAFFPSQGKSALSFSLSELNNAEQVSLSKPLAFLSNTDPVDSLLTRSGVVVLTNSERQKQGLKPLAVNVKLNAGAMAKAQDMFTNQYFEHVSPSGKGPSDVATAAGYDFILIGENLASGNFKDDTGLVQAWMNSPGHRANILNPRYQEIGVAVLKGTYKGQSTWMAVQEFGLPSSVCTATDPKLKDQIAANKILLTTEDSDLQARKTALDSMNQSTDQYIQQASDYNALVKSYNNLVEQTKEMVTKYNDEVTSYNTCAQG